jgi:hypothetical protein
MPLGRGVSTIVLMRWAPPPFVQVFILRELQLRADVAQSWSQHTYRTPRYW